MYKLVEELKAFWKTPDWAKLFSLIVLGLPPGLIFVFIINTIQFWLNAYGLSKMMIGIFSLALLPNVFKFIWAPFLEIIRFPVLSRYLPNKYAWSVALCFLICCNLFIISWQSPDKGAWLIFFLVLCMSTLTASLEINLDAIRIEIVPKKQQGYASSFYAFGYRLGTIMGAFGVLYVSEYFSWQAAFYFIISVLLFLLAFLFICAWSFYKEPLVIKEKAKKNEKLISRDRFKKAIQRFKEPFMSFVNSKHWFSVLFFIFIFRMGDNFINNMSNIFYLDIGFSQIDIANVVKFFGVFFTIIGTFLGGYLVMKYHDMKALLFSGFVHVLSNFMYLVQAYVGYNLTVFYIAVAFENVTAGMATIAFIAYLSNLCKKPYTGSHYALFSSIWYLGTSCSALGGVLASYFSWKVFFMICIILGFGSLLIPVYLKDFFLNKDEKSN